MQLTFITVGSLKEKYLSEAVDEYVKRLSPYAVFKEINCKEEKIVEESEAKIREALESEGDKILSRIPEGAKVIALCVEGKELSSAEFASLLENYGSRTGKVCFIIGSSYGLSPKVKERADFRLSFSKMTFPHQLMRVCLSEAVYRAFTICAGKKYHK
ncbi:MAG: 23S rRNA (pseudouridine(1915)-N(3))-methyltransferase RlmH [Clostridia bacterium]|nr:23S rRNA (pseudouridine(1915)-N(3))-methyltransferase RlmH [Clostridia bacterium]